MNTSLIIIFAFALFALYLGIRSSRGKDINLDEFAVGNKGFGTLFVFLLIAGEVYTTFTFLGGSGWAYSNGAAAFYVPAYICLAYVLSYWLIPKVWRYSKDHHIISQPSYFASFYKSTALGIIVAILGTAALVPYIMIQLKGLGIIVSEASYGAISPAIASTIGAVIVTTYVIISGMHGSAWTAVVKDIMILAVIIFLGLYIPYHYFGGIRPLFEAVQATQPEKLTLADSGFSISWFISTVLLNALGFYLLPNSFSVALTANSEKALRKNAITLPLYTLLLLFAFFIGFAAIVQIPGLQGSEGDLSLLRLSIQTFDPWVIGVVGAAGLLTALVPASVMLNSASIGLTTGIYRVINPNASERKQLLLSKILIVVIVIIALYFAVNGSDALAMLNILSYAIITQLAPGLLFSFSKKPLLNKYGVIAGILAAVAVIFYMSLTGAKIATFFPNVPTFINDISTGMLALILNFIVAICVSLLTKSLVKEKEEEAVLQQSPAQLEETFITK
ncbi:sodium:solute symporter family protein [Ureibacillus sp. FSL K6-0786]|uniref:sodium:solute symporter family protein n=1 Tax=Ureibacillus sp. FSL K6-0786 TaxID=2954607 RepID=UPI0030D90179